MGSGVNELEQIKKWWARQDRRGRICVYWAIFGFFSPFLGFFQVVLLSGIVSFYFTIMFALALYPGAIFIALLALLHLGHSPSVFDFVVFVISFMVNGVFFWFWAWIYYEIKEKGKWYFVLLPIGVYWYLFWQAGYPHPNFKF